MKNFDKFLQELVYSYENVPFYRKKLDNLGIDALQIRGEADLAKLPFTAKVDFRKNFPKGVLAEGFFPKHPMVVSTDSSGSTGERLTTIEIGMYLLQRAISCAEVNPAIKTVFTTQGRKIARFAAPNCSDVECANPNSRMEDRMLPDNTLVLPVYHDLLTTPDKMLDTAIAEIEEFKPDMFYVDPTHFAFLLQAYKKRGLTPPSIPVMVSYTGVTDVSKRQIAEFYDMNCEFGELLSSSEFGWIAMECPHGHLHLNDDSFFFEFIHNDGTDAAGENFVELCITSLDQGASPHMRYLTDDLVTLVEGSCACGSDRQRIVMHGRQSHFISQKGIGVLSPKQVYGLIGVAPWLQQYQLEQLSDESFVFKMIVNEDYVEGAQNKFIAKLQQALNINIKVQSTIVNYIASERSGKFQPVKGI